MATSSTVGAGLEVASELLKLINAYVNPSQQRAAQLLYDAARDDMEEFCRSLLFGDAGTCNRLIAGLRVSAPLPRLANGELEQLSGNDITLPRSVLADLYIRARQGDYAARLAELISTGASSASAKTVVSTAVQSAANVASAAAAAAQQ